MEEKEEIHLVKRVSKELGLTYKELGEKIGYTEGSLRRSVSTNQISSQLERAIELYLEIIKLKEKEQRTDEVKALLRTFILE